jgi:hypothetical protein
VASRLTTGQKCHHRMADGRSPRHSAAMSCQC